MRTFFQVLQLKDASVFNLETILKVSIHLIRGNLNIKLPRRLQKLSNIKGRSGT